MIDRQTPAEERSVVDVIRGIREHNLDPVDLTPEDRRACVSHLSNEGYLAPEIAQVLRISDRTVRRDREAIRESQRLTRDPLNVERFAGRLVAEAELSIALIRRSTRGRDAPIAARIDGARACFGVVDRLVQRLQSLGYLPTAAHQLNAEVTHRVGVPDLTTLQAQIEALRENEHLYGNAGPEVAGQLEHLDGVSSLLVDAEVVQSGPGASDGSDGVGGPDSIPVPSGARSSDGSDGSDGPSTTPDANGPADYATAS